MKSALINSGMFAAAMAVSCLTATATPSQADPAGTSVVPAQTTVLLLSPADQTVDSARFAGLHEAVVTHRLEYDFISRQFAVIGPSMAKAIAAKANLVTLADPAQRTPDNLKKIADAAKADWVVSVNVLEVKHDTFTPGNRTDHAKLHLIVYDAKSGSILADKDVIKTQNSAGQSVGVLGLMIETISYTTQAALKNLLAPYPQTVKVDNELGADDYLFGQTKPVVGDPKKLFTALAAPPPSTGSVRLN